MKLTCIVCPVGCEIFVNKKGDEIVVTGNGCLRGVTFAKDELICPKRIVTCVLKCKNNQIIAVKTTKPVPKNNIKNVLNEIFYLKPKSAKFGEVLVENLLNLNTDIVVTKE